MKTTKLLNDDIERLLIRLEHESLKPLQITRIQNEIACLKDIKNFLEFNPNEEYLKSEQVRLKEFIKKCRQNFIPWTKSENRPPSISFKKSAFIYNNQSGINKAIKQLKTIEFILKG